MKNLVAGEGYWTCVKEVLGWILNTEAGTVTLPERKLEELLTPVDIPATQRRMGRKDLEGLVGKFRSMHLAVPGAVAHLFHIQQALDQGGVDRVWISLTNPLGTITNSDLNIAALIYRRPPSLRQSPRLAWRHRTQVQTILRLSPGSRMRPQ